MRTYVLYIVICIVYETQLIFLVDVDLHVTFILRVYAYFKGNSIYRNTKNTILLSHYDAPGADMYLFIYIYILEPGVELEKVLGNLVSKNFIHVREIE